MGWSIWILGIEDKDSLDEGLSCELGPILIMSTASSEDGCAPAERSPTRATEVVRLEIAKLSIESGVSLVEIVHSACQRTAETLNIARVGVWTLVNQNTTLKCVKLYEAATKSWSEGTLLQIADFPEYFSQLCHRKIVPAETALTDPKTSELVEPYLKPLGITSLLDAPIYVGGEVIGVLCCEHIGPPREWSTEERDFVASMADLLAIKHRAAQVHKLRKSLEINERRLMDLEKSDALAKLALGVAHDFRNVLSSIINSVYVLKIAEDLPSRLRESLSIIEEAANVGTRLVSEMVEYGRDTPARPEALNPNLEIDKFLPVLQTAVGKEYVVQHDATDVRGKIFIDRNQFDRVLLNLVVNAREASAPGSTIKIRTDQAPQEDEATSNFITVEIEDPGQGMDAETLKRLFDPFFSTKESGTGLGMAIVQRIVDRAGGFIRVDSKPGCGTTIRVHLPRVSVTD